jgi:hypothetical protein
MWRLEFLPSDSCLPEHRVTATVVMGVVDVLEASSARCRLCIPSCRLCIARTVVAILFLAIDPVPVEPVGSEKLAGPSRAVPSDDTAVIVP